jgi:hypothetical protein
LSQEKVEKHPMSSAEKTSMDLGEVIRTVTLPALAAWAIPGLGHAMIGQKARGGILFATVMTLFVAGIFLGGVDTFDTGKSGLVAWCQIGLAPCLPASQLVRSIATTTNRTGERLPYTPGLGKSQEQGWVFTGTAGLLNIIAILDLVLREPRRRGGEPQKGSEKEPQGGTEASA